MLIRTSVCARTHVHTVGAEAREFLVDALVVVDAGHVAHARENAQREVTGVLLRPRIRRRHNLGIHCIEEERNFSAW